MLTRLWSGYSDIDGSPETLSVVKAHGFQLQAIYPASKLLPEDFKSNKLKLNFMDPEYTRRWKIRWAKGRFQNNSRSGNSGNYLVGAGRILGWSNWKLLSFLHQDLRKWWGLIIEKIYSYLIFLDILDIGKLTSTAVLIRLAPNPGRIVLPIKIVDLIFPFGIYIENTSNFDLKHRLKT